MADTQTEEQARALVRQALDLLVEDEEHHHSRHDVEEWLQRELDIAFGDAVFVVSVPVKEVL